MSVAGPFGAEKGNLPGKCFSKFIRDHGLWLPGTFQTISDCSIEKTKTFHHSTGKLFRSDYIAIPTSHMSHQNHYTVLHDVCIAGEPFLDHVPVFCVTQASSRPPEQWYSYNNSEFDIKLLDSENIHYYNQFMKKILPIPKFSDPSSLQYYITGEIKLF